MLAADPDLQIRPRLAPLPHRQLHQPADPVLVDGLERISRQDLLLQVADDEVPLGVVAREPERRLRQVVGAEGEELGLRCDLAGGERGPRDLDHRAELVRHCDSLLLLHVLRHGLEQRVHLLQLCERADKRDHDLRTRIDPALAQVAGRLDDRAHLHARYLGKEDRQADAAQPEHRVRLVQVEHAREHAVELVQLGRLLVRRAQDRRLGDELLEIGQELVQRRITTGLPAITLRIPRKYPRWIGSRRASCFSRSGVVPAMIMALTIGSRSDSMNMCSVRHRPTPCAPFSSALRASRG